MSKWLCYGVLCLTKQLVKDGPFQEDYVLHGWVISYIILRESVWEQYVWFILFLEDKAAEEIVLNYDKTLAKLVDTLILYLRLVHSVDYYNNAEYRNEDEMPNRCGIIHVRGEPPSNPIMPFEMHDYLKKFAEKVDALIQERKVSNKVECVFPMVVVSILP